MSCTLCDLHKTCSTVKLPGKGPEDADILIVGETPGIEEDKTGVPSIGRSGQQLHQLLSKAGIKMESVRITNAIKCRPPNNKTPSAKQIKACKVHLMEEIETQGPKIIITLGATAAKAVGLKGPMKNLRSGIHQTSIGTILPTWHPSLMHRVPKAEADLVLDLKRFKKIAHEGVPEAPEINVETILKKKDVLNFKQWLWEQKYLAFDIETRGLNPRMNSMTALGLGNRLKQWFIPVDLSDCTQDDQSLIEMIKHVISVVNNWVTSGGVLITQNGKFDNSFVYGYTEKRFFINQDTLINSHLLDEDSPTGLKWNVINRLSGADYDIPLDQLLGAGCLEELLPYAALDLYYTDLLYRDQMERILDHPELIPVSKMMAQVQACYEDIERNGIYIELGQLKRTKINIVREIVQTRSRLKKLSGSEINWGSPVQLGKLLYDDLGYEPYEYTPSGAYSTSESCLLRSVDQGPIFKELLKYRELTKLLNTYLTGWTKRLEGEYLYPRYKLHGTVTGRPSCVDPNLQQTPRDDRIRSLVSAPKGWVFFEADYSQIELRVAAVQAEEDNLIKVFQNGGDPHWTTTMSIIQMGGEYSKLAVKTARAIYARRRIHVDEGIHFVKDAIPILRRSSIDECESIDKEWKEVRKRAKSAIFGFLYGMRAPKFIDYAFEKYGITMDLKEAEAFRRMIFESYPALLPWHKKVEIEVQGKGYIQTMTGRIRHLPQVFSGEKWIQQEAIRAAINSPVQGSAAELLMMSLVDIRKKIPEAKLCGTIHDAIVGRIKEKDVYKLKELPVIMANPSWLGKLGIKFPIPLEVDLKIGPWGRGKSL